MNFSLKIKAFSTDLFNPKGHLVNFVTQSLASYTVGENSVLAISSKLFSLAENQIDSSTPKEKLILQEADKDLGEGSLGYRLTIKEGLLLPSAGVDQSNSPSGDFLLFPKDPYSSLKKLWQELKKKWSLRNLGLIMTDSHTTPLRRGVTGVAVAHWGFKAVRDCKGSKDLYGRELKVTSVNNIDALSSMAVWMMGEGDEKRPLVLIEKASLEWQDESSKDEIRIPLKEDLYQHLFKV